MPVRSLTVAVEGLKSADFVDFVGLMVKLTLLFTEMLPFEKVRLRLNGSSPAPSLSTISIDVYVDEGGGATWEGTPCVATPATS